MKMCNFRWEMSCTGDSCWPCRNIWSALSTNCWTPGTRGLVGPEQDGFLSVCPGGVELWAFGVGQGCCKTNGQSPAKTKASQFSRLTLWAMVSNLTPPGIGVKVNDEMASLKTSQSCAYSFSGPGSANFLWRAREWIFEGQCATDCFHHLFVFVSFFSHLKMRKIILSPQAVKTGHRSGLARGPQFATSRCRCQRMSLWCPVTVSIKH